MRPSSGPKAQRGANAATRVCGGVTLSASGELMETVPKKRATIASNGLAGLHGPSEILPHFGSILNDGKGFGTHKIFGCLVGSDPDEDEPPPTLFQCVVRPKGASACGCLWLSPLHPPMWLPEL